MVDKRSSKKVIDNLKKWSNDVLHSSDRVWAGIDPGLNGAVAFVDENGSGFVISTPTYTVKKGKKQKREYDIESMILCILPFAKKNVVFCQELTHAMPGNGNVSMYSFGRGHGLWEGIVSALNMPLMFTSPQQWKKSYPSLINSIKPLSPKEKQQNKINSKKEAIILAGVMFPNCKNNISKLADDGKAEALLIANHCMNTFKGR